MSNYTDVFGSQTLPPSEFREQTLALTASTTLYWPYNYTGTGGIVAKINKLTSTGAYTITMPDATLVSTGEDVLWDNTSAYTITLHDSAGGTIGTVAAGAQKYLYLTDNSTAAGTWRVFTFGTGTSSADAAALAGYGTTATGSTLSGNIPLTVTALAATATTASRGSGYVFTGGSVAFTLPTCVTATAGFYVDCKNAGTGTVTITPVGGDLVDGNATLGLNPGESCRLECDGASNWYTVGLGRSTIYQFTKLVKDLTGLTSYTLSSADASNKLLQFTGAPAGATTVTVPTVVAIYYVESSTSNAYTITLKTASGTGISVAQNASVILYCDGVNVVSAQTSSVPASSMVVSNDIATAVPVYPTWVSGAGSAATFSVSTAKMSFVPSTGVLTATGFAGSLTGNVTGNVTGYATALKSATTTVDVSAATAPSLNQVLTATDSTHATWQTPTSVSYPITADKGGTGVTNNAASTITISGNFASTFTVSGAYNYTFPSATSTLAILGANTFTGTQTGGDNIAVQWMQKDIGNVVVDKGNINNATCTFDYTAGSYQTFTSTGSTVTLAFSNWPPTGNLGVVLVAATNAGAYTLTMPTVNWIKPDGTTTTTFSTYLAANTGRTALQSSGIDFILFWSRDAGTTIYGKLV